mgnify:CR=1 FL=1|tara:strand:- start:315 stop:788 length:474 start_codon:yes stop_codon:yes gene_type:complete
MPNYKNGTIYKLVDNTNGETYIGSTTQTLARRRQKHISDSKNYGKIINNRVVKYSSHPIIMNRDYKIILIEYYPCNTKDELRMKEQEWIDKTECINSQRAYRTIEQEKEQCEKCWKARNGTKKMKDYKQALYAYQLTWGGNKQTCNNLLSIDINLFM